MPEKFSVPRGTSDVLPAEASVWLALEQCVRQILSNYNFKEIRTPLLEETELFARSMGQMSDVVQKQILTLAAQKKDELDQAGLSGLSLRPESTASVVRSYIENRMDKKEGISKLFYIGPMFRGERPQKGRLRQFHQVGAEVIGPETLNPMIDAEVIALCVNLLKGLGLDGFTLKISTLGSQEDKQNLSKILRKKIKPHIEKLSDDSKKRFDRNVFRILDSKEKSDRQVIDQLNLNYDHLSDESYKYYTEVKKGLELLGVGYEESIGLVRGLDYYTHTVFEISDKRLGSQDALGAGGRYNNLVSQLGGPEVDAVGFALGIERILLVLDGKLKGVDASLKVYIVALTEAAQEAACVILKELRGHNCASDMNYKLGSIKSQMRAADKSGAEWVFIIGEDELADKKITVKNLKSGRQDSLALTEIKQFIRNEC